jgi:hypothetical protein
MLSILSRSSEICWNLGTVAVVHLIRTFADREAPQPRPRRPRKVRAIAGGGGSSKPPMARLRGLGRPPDLHLSECCLHVPTPGQCRHMSTCCYCLRAVILDYRFLFFAMTHYCRCIALSLCPFVDIFLLGMPGRCSYPLAFAYL